MKGEFLPRAHSRRLGELERSNWKILRSESDFGRIDPAIRDIVSMLNQKGYTTFSSCSGGHITNPRWRVNRHESGYLAFSPPSNIAFTLYFALRKHNRDFAFEAQAVVDNGDGGDRETICTRFYWQLSDQKKPRQKYYTKLFTQMKRTIGDLPPAPTDGKQTLTGLFGPSHSESSKIVSRQMRRFNSS
jgi:Methyltransferase TYW3